MSATAAAAPPEHPAIWSHIRLADRRDLPILHHLITQAANFQHHTDHFFATESSLSALFPSPPLPPFHSFTLLILEISPSPIPATEDESTQEFRPTTRRVGLSSAVDDPEAAAYASPRGGGRVVAGFVLCFPNFSTFMGRSGMYVEDIFVREAWRRLGFGRMMLATVAREAARMGCGKVDWCVLEWNRSAIEFYEEMGAQMLPQLKICRLSGEELRKYVVDDEGCDNGQ